MISRCLVYTVIILCISSKLSAEVVKVDDIGEMFCYISPSSVYTIENGTVIPTEGLFSFFPFEKAPIKPHIEFLSSVVQGNVIKVRAFHTEHIDNLTVQLVDSTGDVQVQSNGFHLEEIEEKDVWVCFIGIRSDLRDGSYFLRIDGESGRRNYTFIRPVSVIKKEFDSERILLNQSLSELRTKRDPKKETEARELWAVILQWNPESYYHQDEFQWPVENGRQTAGFGDRRVYEYFDGKEGLIIHNGLDFAVPIGTPIMACGRGKVVLVRDRIVTGKTIIIEHVSGIFSAYYHLSEILVQKNDIVGNRQRIGKAGNSGLATGPHLHWEIRVSGTAVDPHVFILQKIIDYDDFFRIIKGIANKTTERR